MREGKHHSWDKAGWPVLEWVQAPTGSQPAPSHLGRSVRSYCTYLRYANTLGTQQVVPIGQVL